MNDTPKTITPEQYHKNIHSLWADLPQWVQKAYQTNKLIHRILDMGVVEGMTAEQCAWEIVKCQVKLNADLQEHLFEIDRTEPVHYLVPNEYLESPTKPTKELDEPA